MLQLVAVVLALVSLSSCVPVNQTEDRFGCTYWYEDGKLACGRSNGQVVSCQVYCEYGVEGNVCEPGKFHHKVFGIGDQCNDTEIVGEQLPRYHLYPRIVQENSTYLNHTVQIGGVGAPIDLVLYQGEKFAFSGLRISDVACFQSLVNIFNTTVPIVGHVGIGEFKLIGDIFVSAGHMGNLGRVVFDVVDNVVV